MEPADKLMGGDGKEYGPVSLNRLKSWIGEGRIDGETQIIRWTYNSGDADYLLFYPATTGPTISAAKNPQGQPVLTFTGVLRAATTVTGPYDVVAGATSPYTVTGGAGTMKFYRAATQ